MSDESKDLGGQSGGDASDRSGARVSVEGLPSAADHPAVEYFHQRLTELRHKRQQRISSTGEMRPLAPHQIHTLLMRQAPYLPISQTQMYRICQGEAVPKIDVVMELGRLFDVSPQYFMPTLGETKKLLPRKRRRGPKLT